MTSMSVRGSVDGGVLPGTSSGGGGGMFNPISSLDKRGDQFRLLYEQLKEEYATLNDAYIDCQRTLEKSTDDNRQMIDKFKNLLDKLQLDNRKKQTQIEEMKTQLLDNTKIDQIRDRLATEIEGPYKSAIQQLSHQLEQIKSEGNQLKMELNARTKEFNSEVKQKDQLIEEIKFKSDKELTSLRKERDLLQQHRRDEQHKDSNVEQTRNREINQAKGKMEQLNEELHQAQQTQTHAEQLAANAQRELIKERSMTKTNLSLLENERDSLKQQFASVHQELTNASEQLANSQRQSHEKDRRIAHLQTEHDNLQHRLKLDAANHKIDLAKLQRELLQQHQQDQLNIQELQEIINSLNSEKNKLQMTIQEKEHLLLTTIQATREDEWKKISQITNEKLDLEAQVNIFKKSQDEREKQFQIERDRLQEQIKANDKFKEELQRDNAQLNNNLKQIQDCQEELQREQDKTRELYRKCTKLETQLSSTNGIEQELTDINLKLKNELNHLINECHANKQDVQQMNQHCTTTIDNARRALFNERKEMEKKIEQLREENKRAKKKIEELQKEKKEFKTRHHNFSQKLIDKSQLIDAKLNEIKQKELSLQNVVTLQTHNRVKRQLTLLLRKHLQFQAVLETPNLNQSPPNNNNQDEVDLQSMFSRLDRLSDEQHEQLNDFIPVKESSSLILSHRQSSSTAKDKRTNN